MPAVTSSKAVQESTVSCSTSSASGIIHAPPLPNPANLVNLEEEFIVERVLDRKTDPKGRVWYLIKWQGFADQDNTWEPEANLSDCPALIADFERRHRDSLSLRTSHPEQFAEIDRPKPLSNAAREKAMMEGDEETLGRIGFERGLRPQKIIGATDCGGELCFLMKWKNSNVADIVPAREANVKCPQVVIRFYERKIRWNNRRPLQEMLERFDEEEGGGEEEDTQSFGGEDMKEEEEEEESQQDSDEEEGDRPAGRNGGNHEGIEEDQEDSNLTEVIVNGHQAGGGGEEEGDVNMEGVD